MGSRGGGKLRISSSQLVTFSSSAGLSVPHIRQSEASTNQLSLEFTDEPIDCRECQSSERIRGTYLATSDKKYEHIIYCD